MRESPRYARRFRACKVRHSELEDEERSASLTNIRRVCAALKIGQQGDLFPAAAASSVEADDPEFDEPDTHADIVGPDSARAAKRQGHSYPRNKFSGKGEATGAVLGEVFGGDAA